MPAERTRSILSFGVAVDVVFPGSVERRLESLLPPSHVVRSGGEPDVTVTMRRDRSSGSVGYRVLVGDTQVASAAEIDVAVNAFDAQLRLAIASQAPEHVFVHAGCVAIDDRALVLPGRSFSGKSTLVAALLEAGAEYLSDEYAVLDSSGRVHPYARPLSIRADDPRRAVDRPPETFGATFRGTTAEVSHVAFLRYETGEELKLEALGGGAAALSMLEHTLPARTRPKASLAAVGQATSRATCLRGVRGDASAAAHELLALMRQ